LGSRLSPLAMPFGSFRGIPSLPLSRHAAAWCPKGAPKVDWRPTLGQPKGDHGDSVDLKEEGQLQLRKESGAVQGHGAALITLGLGVYFVTVLQAASQQL
jgi:hypothetical protein